MGTLLGSPTRAGYLAFLRAEAGIPVSALPDNSMSIDLSLSIAQDIVSCWLNQISSDIYTICVYNLATDRLIHFAPDQPGQTYFAEARKLYGVNSFVAGVVESSTDQGTSQSIAVPDSLRNLTMLDLQTLQTPFGRAYMAYAQQLGTLWGLT